MRKDEGLAVVVKPDLFKDFTSCIRLCILHRSDGFRKSRPSGHFSLPLIAKNLQASTVTSQRLAIQNDFDFLMPQLWKVGANFIQPTGRHPWRQSLPEFVRPHRADNYWDFPSPGVAEFLQLDFAVAFPKSCICWHSGMN